MGRAKVMTLSDRGKRGAIVGVAARTRAKDQADEDERKIRRTLRAAVAASPGVEHDRIADGLVRRFERERDYSLLRAANRLYLGRVPS